MTGDSCRGGAQGKPSSEVWISRSKSQFLRTCREKTKKQKQKTNKFLFTRKNQNNSKTEANYVKNFFKWAKPIIFYKHCEQVVLLSKKKFEKVFFYKKKYTHSYKKGIF